MVRIRLRRVGLKKQPSYRIVVIDQERPRDGRYIESIGFYNPRTRPTTIQLQEDRALYWLSVGAQPSEPVGKLLKITGTADRLQRLRKGESLESLVAEAEQAQAEAEAVNPRTRYPAPESSAKKSQDAVDAAVAEAEAAAEADADADTATE